MPLPRCDEARPNEKAAGLRIGQLLGSGDLNAVSLSGSAKRETVDLRIDTFAFGWARFIWPAARQ